LNPNIYKENIHHDMVEILEFYQKQFHYLLHNMEYLYTKNQGEVPWKYLPTIGEYEKTVELCQVFLSPYNRFEDILDLIAGMLSNHRGPLFMFHFFHQKDLYIRFRTRMLRSQIEAEKNVIIQEMIRIKKLKEAQERKRKADEAKKQAEIEKNKGGLFGRLFRAVGSKIEKSVNQVVTKVEKEVTGALDKAVNSLEGNDIAALMKPDDSLKIGSAEDLKAQSSGSMAQKLDEALTDPLALPWVGLTKATAKEFKKTYATFNPVMKRCEQTANVFNHKIDQTTYTAKNLKEDFIKVKKTANVLIKTSKVDLSDHWIKNLTIKRFVRIITQFLRQGQQLKRNIALLIYQMKAVVDETPVFEDLYMDLSEVYENRLREILKEREEEKQRIRDLKNPKKKTSPKKETFSKEKNKLCSQKKIF